MDGPLRWCKLISWQILVKGFLMITLMQQSPKTFYYFYLPAPRVVAVTADRRPSMAPSNASNVNTVGSNLFGVYDSPTMLPRTPLAPGMYLY